MTKQERLAKAQELVKLAGELLQAAPGESSSLSQGSKTVTLQEAAIVVKHMASAVEYCNSITGDAYSAEPGNGWTPEKERAFDAFGMQLNELERVLRRTMKALGC
jgi:roadblock/LC7 domain-containing protein